VVQKFKTINFELKDNIAYISFLKPKVNKVSLKELRQVLGGLVGDESLEGVILHGTADFCSCADPKELKNLSYANAREFSKLGQDTFLLLNRIEAPCIAAISGAAIGPGLELALACDVRIATNNATLGHCKGNHPPCFGGSVRLAKIIGPKAADNIVKSQKMYSALEAHHAGIVDYVVDKKSLLFEAERIIRGEPLTKNDFRQDDFIEEQEAFARVISVVKRQADVPEPIKKAKGQPIKPAMKAKTQIKVKKKKRK